jgi:hypothetical protein
MGLRVNACAEQLELFSPRNHALKSRGGRMEDGEGGRRGEKGMWERGEGKKS